MVKELLINLLKQITPPFIWEILRKINKLRILTQVKLSEEKKINPINKRIIYLEEEFKKYNQGLSINEINIRPDLNLLIHPNSRIGFEHFCYNSPKLVDQLNLFLKLIRNKKRLLDIGALHGIFSLVFAIQKNGNEVIAVDASPIVYSTLLYNIYKNNLRNIIPIECAVSDKCGEISMHYEWEHAVIPGTNNRNENLKVKMITGDEICNSNNFIPDVIKIDVEGHEVNVIKGLENTIINHEPLIFLEVHPSRIMEQEANINNIKEFFLDIGYKTINTSNEEILYDSIPSLEDGENIILIKE